MWSLPDGNLSINLFLDLYTLIPCGKYFFIYSKSSALFANVFPFWLKLETEMDRTARCMPKMKAKEGEFPFRLNRV